MFTAGEKETGRGYSYAIAERIRSPSDAKGRQYTTRSMWWRLRQPFPISGTNSFASPSLSKSHRAALAVAGASRRDAREGWNVEATRGRTARYL